jgi:hypothetical protein
MGNSTGPRELHVDQHLTNLAINYRPQNFIADQIAPIVPVDKQRNTYPVYSRNEFFSIEDAKRGPGAQAKKITRSVGSAFYQAENYALGMDWLIEDEANMDVAYRALSAAGKATYLQGKLMLATEKRVLDMVTATTAVGSLFVCNSAWSAAGTSAGDPMVAVEQMKEYAKLSTGHSFNSILMGWRAWSRLRRNANFRNLILGNNNGGGLVTRQAAQSLFEVDRLVVADAVWHAQNEGQTASVTSMTNPLADLFILYYAPQRASLDEPSWMYSFQWKNPILPAPLTVFRHPYDSKTRSETIEVDMYQDERLVGTDFALGILTNVASGAAGLG